MSPPSIPTLNLTQHHDHFQRAGSLQQVAKILELQLWTIQGWFPLGLTGLDLLVVQETFKAFLHNYLKTSILQHSTLFMVQNTLTSVHDCYKTIALTRWMFVDKVMSMLFNMLSRFVIAFLPRRKCLLISWLQSLSAVILETKEIKPVTVSTFTFPFVMKWWNQMPWS